MVRQYVIFAGLILLIGLLVIDGMVFGPMLR